MRATKEKILESAIHLFNAKGLINVRLQHIADDAGISVGNLAYHYHSKKAIVIAIDGELEHTIQPIMTIDDRVPYMIDLDNQLSDYYFLIKKFAFYFLDLLEMERAYPRLHQKRKIYIDQMIGNTHKWITINIEQDIIKPELHENQYLYTAHAVWIILTFWLTQQKIRGLDQEDEIGFKQVVWNQFLPLFTERGQLEYEAIILPQFTQLIPGNRQK
jgi:AcrR family transcriptional regulator